jgi:hypothetical protein
MTARFVSGEDLRAGRENCLENLLHLRQGFDDIRFGMSGRNRALLDRKRKEVDAGPCQKLCPVGNKELDLGDTPAVR